MPAHRPDHSQRKFGSLAQQGHKFCFRNKNDRARNQGRGRWRDNSLLDAKSRFGKGITGMKDMDDLHLSRSVDAIDDDTPRWTTKKPSQGSPSRKKIFAFSRFLTVEKELISAMSAVVVFKDLRADARILNHKMIEARVFAMDGIDPARNEIKKAIIYDLLDLDQGSKTA